MGTLRSCNPENNPYKTGLLAERKYSLQLIFWSLSKYRIQFVYIGIPNHKLGYIPMSLKYAVNSMSIFLYFYKIRNANIPALTLIVIYLTCGTPPKMNSIPYEWCSTSSMNVIMPATIPTSFALLNKLSFHFIGFLKEYYFPESPRTSIRNKVDEWSFSSKRLSNMDYA